MKNDFDLSYNLFYMDQFGSIEDQMLFIDSLHIVDVQKVYFNTDSSVEYHLVCTYTKDSDNKGKVFYSKLICIKPSLDGKKSFLHKDILDIGLYLKMRKGFAINTVITHYIH